MFLFFQIFFIHKSFWCSCFVIEIISHLLKIEIADFCANEMSGQFDRMDFGDLELGVCYPLLCEWVCIVYKNSFLFHRHLHMAHHCFF